MKASDVTVPPLVMVDPTELQVPVSKVSAVLLVAATWPAGSVGAPPAVMTLPMAARVVNLPAAFVPTSMAVLSMAAVMPAPTLVMVELAEL